MVWTDRLEEEVADGWIVVLATETVEKEEDIDAVLVPDEQLVHVLVIVVLVAAEQEEQEAGIEALDGVLDGTAEEMVVVAVK